MRVGAIRAALDQVKKEMPSAPLIYRDLFAADLLPGRKAAAFIPVAAPGENWAVVVDLYLPANKSIALTSYMLPGLHPAIVGLRFGNIAMRVAQTTAWPLHGELPDDALTARPRARVDVNQMLLDLRQQAERGAITGEELSERVDRVLAGKPPRDPAPSKSVTLEGRRGWLTEPLVFGPAERLCVEVLCHRSVKRHKLVLLGHVAEPMGFTVTRPAWI